MPSEPSGAPQAPVTPGPASAPVEPETGDVLAAIDRLQNAAGAVEHLREELLDLADAVRRARAALDQAAMKPDTAAAGKADAAALLAAVEDRLTGLLQSVGASPAPKGAPPVEATAEASDSPPDDAVPTVSHVVSRLGRWNDALDAERAAKSAAPSPDSGVPTVSSLGAMVEALAASMPPDPQPSPGPQPAEAPQADPSQSAAAEAPVPPAAMLPELELPRRDVAAPAATEPGTEAAETTDLDPAGILGPASAGAEEGPADFLLEPVPARGHPLLPPAELPRGATAAGEAAQPRDSAPQPSTSDPDPDSTPPDPDPRAAPYDRREPQGAPRVDPLAPLASLSEAEIIALFG